MKKRILSLLLVVAMLATMIVMPVYAAEETEGSAVAQSTTAETATDMSQTCPCCGKTFAEITWTDLDVSTWATGKAKTDVASGHYKVTGSVTYTGQIYLKSGTGTGTNVVLDLAGATLAANGCRNFYMLGVSDDDKMNLTIIDSVGGATLTSTYNAGGTVYAGKYSTINLYGGTYYGSDSATHGGALYATGSSVMNVYAPTTVYGSTVSGKGGAGYVSGGVMNIYGGTIIDGTSSQGEGITVNGGTLNISGGTVGTVYATSTSPTVNISGDAVVEKLDLTGAAATFNIKDLTEGASIGIKETVASEVGATIDDETYLTNGSVYSTWNYADLSVVDGVLTMSDNICPHCGKTYSEITDWTEWTYDNSSANVKLSANTAGSPTVTLEEGKSYHYYLNDNISVESNKKFYLGTKDTEDTTTCDVVLDMRGYSYTNTKGGFFYLYNNGKNLTVCDSVGGSTVSARNTGGGASSTSISPLYISGNSTMKLYDIAFTNTMTTNYDGDYAKTSRGLINLAGNGVLIAEGCTFTGSVSHQGGVLYNTYGTATFTDCTLNGCDVTAQGAAIYTTSGDVTLNNCTVNGGAATNGGAIYITSGSVTVNGGTVNGGTVSSHGGAIYATTGDIIINGATVNGGEATTHGGAIYSAGGNISITNGATINRGSARLGGTIYYVNEDDLDTALTVEDSTIIGGTSGSNGGMMYMRDNTVANIKGSTIYGGTCETNYGGVAFVFTTAAITVEDSTVVSGSAAAHPSTGYSTDGIYGSGAMTVIDSEVEDITFTDSGAGVTLSGEVKANLLLVGSAEVDVSGMTGGAVTVTAGAGAFTAALDSVDAATDLLPYFTSGVEGLSVEVDELCLSMTPGAFIAYCHDCGQSVEWEVFDPVLDVVNSSNYLHMPLNNGETCHYYLIEDYSAGTMMRIGYGLVDGAPTCVPGEDVHIELNGFTYDNSARGFYVYRGSSLHIQDTSAAGTGKVVAEGQNGQTGAVLYVEGGKASENVGPASLTVYGGTYVYEVDANRVNEGGSVLMVPASTEVTVENAVLDGSAFSGDYTGGAIRVGNDSTLTLKNTEVIGGDAKNGGSIYAAANSTLNLEGTTDVHSGTATSYGGNIYCVGATTNMSDTATVRDGESDYRGGNVAFTDGTISDVIYTGGLNIADQAVISGGTADDGGNAFLMEGAVINMTGGTVTGGTARLDPEVSTCGRGGNLYLSTGDHQISGGTISNGISLAAKESFGGGNIYVYGVGTLTISGTVAITGGSSSSNGGNIYSQGSLTLNGGTISGGTASVNGDDIYVDGPLVVSDAVTGDLGMGFDADQLGKPAYGNTITDTTVTTLNANMVLDGDYCNAPIVAQDGALFVQGGGAAIEALSGEVTYYPTAADAVEVFDVNNHAWIIICGNNTLELTKAQYYGVDLNGCTVTLNGVEGSNVTCIDSVNEDYENFGYLTLGANVALNNEIQIDAEGHDYITLYENGQYSFHVLDMELVAVSLKTKTGGLYYTSEYYCDEVLAAHVDTFGTILKLNSKIEGNSLEAILGAELTQYTELGIDDFKTKTEFTSAVMNGIIGTGTITVDGVEQTNKQRGAMVLYAAPYLITDTGAAVWGTEEIGMSLKDVCDAIDANISELLAADAADATAANYIAYMTNLFTAGEPCWGTFGLLEGEDAWSFTNFPKTESTETETDTSTEA